ncbi:hypothetical protein RIF29_16635 [Crotalaria pallida]|uniref:Uncharacterized protein n=1 Tax=Crotalaria pallida TaxID=3830 RepID=A0AAN9IJZ5_CROPI
MLHAYVNTKHIPSATGIVVDNSGAVSQGVGALSGVVAKSVVGGVGKSSGAKMDVIPKTNTSAEEGE